MELKTGVPISRCNRLLGTAEGRCGDNDELFVGAASYEQFRARDRSLAYAMPGELTSTPTQHLHRFGEFRPIQRQRPHSPQTIDAPRLPCEIMRHPSPSRLQVNTPSASLVDPGGLPVARTLKRTFAHRPSAAKAALTSSTCMQYSGFPSAILWNFSRCALGEWVMGKTSSSPGCEFRRREGEDRVREVASVDGCAGDGFDVGDGGFAVGVGAGGGDVGCFCLVVDSGEEVWSARIGFCGLLWRPGSGRSLGGVDSRTKRVGTFLLGSLSTLRCFFVGRAGGGRRLWL